MNGRGLGRCARSGARPGSPGISSLTTAPPPGRWPAVTWPPCASAMARTMASPRPAPPSLRARSWSGRRNRSNACGRKSAGKPGPRSRTSITSAGPSPSGRQHHVRPARGEPQRIVHQVVHGLPDPARVGRDHQPSRRVDPAGDASLSRPALQPARRCGRAGTDIRRLRANASLPSSPRASSSRSSVIRASLVTSSPAMATAAASSSLLRPGRPASSSSPASTANGVRSSWLASAAKARCRASARATAPAGHSWSRPARRSRRGCAVPGGWTRCPCWTGRRLPAASAPPGPARRGPASRRRSRPRPGTPPRRSVARR